MKATFTIHDLVSTYTKFMVGEFKYVNRSDEFTSEFLCHIIGELLVPVEQVVVHSGISYPMAFGDMENVDSQFRQQWCANVLNTVPPYSGVMERWNADTEYSPIALKMGQGTQNLKWRMTYRMKCLEKAAEQFPDLTFTFTNFLPQDN